jgi:hypothetical protein
MKHESKIDLVVDEHVIALRNEYRACLKIANESDSKKETSFLLDEALRKVKELKKICKHKYIICLHSLYKGSYSYDYDDAHPELRICICCGEVESSYDSFLILKNKPFSRFENNAPVQIKKPLLYLLNEVIEVAESQGFLYFK